MITLFCPTVSGRRPSAVRTAPYRIRTRGPMTTLPEITALGAIHAVGSTCGRWPRCSTSTVRILRPTLEVVEGSALLPRLRHEAAELWRHLRALALWTYDLRLLM